MKQPNLKTGLWRTEFHSAQESRPRGGLDFSNKVGSIRSVFEALCFKPTPLFRFQPVCLLFPPYHEIVVLRNKNSIVNPGFIAPGRTLARSDKPQAVYPEFSKGYPERVEGLFNIGKIIESIRAVRVERVPCDMVLL